MECDLVRVSNIRSRKIFFESYYSENFKRFDSRRRLRNHPHEAYQPHRRFATCEYLDRVFPPKRKWIYTNHSPYGLVTAATCEFLRPMSAHHKLHRGQFWYLVQAKFDIRHICHLKNLKYLYKTHRRWIKNRTVFTFQHYCLCCSHFFLDQFLDFHESQLETKPTHAQPTSVKDDSKTNEAWRMHRRLQMLR